MLNYQLIVHEPGDLSSPMGILANHVSLVIAIGHTAESGVIFGPRVEKILYVIRLAEKLKMSE